MHLPIIIASRQPLPKPFVETLCVLACLAMIAQTI
jgi:hypothetical protein